MKGDPVALVTTRTPDSYRWLACAVIKQAWIDVTDEHLHPLKRSRARLFLSGQTSGLAHWCALLGVDPAIIASRAVRTT
jgi:hypothetical protein